MGYLKTLTINGKTYSIASTTPVKTVTLLARNWVGNASPYSQVITIPGVTPSSKVDLLPNVEQVEIFRSKDIAFTTKNINGVVTAYAIGDKPKNDYTMQVQITEVVL